MTSLLTRHGNVRRDRCSGIFGRNCDAHKAVSRANANVALGHSRPGRASSKFGDVGYALKAEVRPRPSLCCVIPDVPLASFMRSAFVTTQRALVSDR